MVLVLSPFTASDAQQTSQISSYEVTVPRRISRQRRNQESSEKVSYVIQARGKERVVILERNELLLPEAFTVFSYGHDGSLLTQRTNTTSVDADDVAIKRCLLSVSCQGHCHYRGYIEDVEGSSAALSLCSGLSSFGIEPLEGSSSGEHLIYRLEDVESEALSCGTPHSHGLDNESSPWEHSISYGRPIRRRRAVLHQTHYVELLLVVDNERYNYKNRNDTAVHEEMVQLANYVDSFSGFSFSMGPHLRSSLQMYVALNIRIVLVGLMIWSQQNLINTNGSAGEVLGRFTQWREKELVPQQRHDSAQLILTPRGDSHSLLHRKKGFGGTAGMAFVGTACSRSHGGGINAFTNNNVMSFASIVAHELGHNLGMNHDDSRNCRCDVPHCIMNSGATGSRNFSSCSADDFEKMILNSGGRCLLNIPRLDEAYSAPFCGNKLVDAGEECDCGSEQECEKDPCCEPRSCRLRAGAQCAFGICCKNCRFLPGGAVCRSSTDECDLTEYCNGSSALCQNDVFKQNGHPCREGQAYCYNGQCQLHDDQCQEIFGKKAKAAPELCFKDVNSKGDRFGNCGYPSSGFRKCESRNAMCGKLQCENVQAAIPFGIKPSFIQTPLAGTTCWGVDFRLGSDVPDPGMVNEGTKCGDNKVCLNFECRSADVLGYDCDVERKCHGHGVCNSNKNCHCEYGWAPPFCQESGYGGSVDSGPTEAQSGTRDLVSGFGSSRCTTERMNASLFDPDKDTSTRDGLLVFFFLVLPLLALSLYVFFRRNELKQRLLRNKRSQGYEADSRPQMSVLQRADPGTAGKEGQQSHLLPPEQGVRAVKPAPVPAYSTRPPPPPPAFTREKEREEEKERNREGKEELEPRAPCSVNNQSRRLSSTDLLHLLPSSSGLRERLLRRQYNSTHGTLTRMESIHRYGAVDERIDPPLMASTDSQPYSAHSCKLTRRHTRLSLSLSLLWSWRSGT
ncbi:hypothetical protein DNTS_015414 [Danionella cerebrum]|uniref:Disintegrin domain-containing protein n=1 Tax=Danionella cerebrum TaxID=2873325 RepID=A0A553R3T6_9TELE|nr:hypothetical protein DNTS_015414 [Danionella translucida]